MTEEIKVNEKQEHIHLMLGSQGIKSADFLQYLGTLKGIIIILN